MACEQKSIKRAEFLANPMLSSLSHSNWNKWGSPKFENSADPFVERGKGILSVRENRVSFRHFNLNILCVRCGRVRYL